LGASAAAEAIMDLSAEPAIVVPAAVINAVMEKIFMLIIGYYCSILDCSG
jgi:hypothetical protein